MSTARTLRLGSRASLLALIQSRLVAAALRAAHPDLQIEIVTFETRGDADIKTPLTETNDPDFFSAELDAALLEGAIDLCVHSYKDVDRQRPEGITLAAVPPRENPADVVLFRPDIEAHLATGNPIRIGSCSERRRRNVEDFLRLALPRKAALPQFEFKPLRGTVPERIDQIAPQSAVQLDAVIVALAGIERLWNDPAGRRRIAPALQSAKLMVLPLSACPTAPGQGALAVECRSDASDTRRLLRAIHDETTAKLLNIEAQLVAEITAAHGARAAAIGATAWPHVTLGYIARARWRGDNNDPIEITRQARQPARPVAAQPWTAPPIKRPAEALPAAVPASGTVFAAHWRAFETYRPNHAIRIWTSGVMSWNKLAARGIWVEGCTDHLGFDQMHAWLAAASLRLPRLENWTAVTHADAVISWAGSGVGQVVATYRLGSPDEASERELAETIANSTHIFWRTPQQYRQLGHLANQDTHHACGPGKTLTALHAAGVKNIAAFPSYREWQQWLA
jgi:hydroxymethylbilane synthase